MERRGSNTLPLPRNDGRRATAQITVVAEGDVGDGLSAELVDAIALQAAREDFAAWLRDQRLARGMTVEDVARITRIQLRALERLEAARFDELPADVFVR